MHKLDRPDDIFFPCREILQGRNLGIPNHYSFMAFKLTPMDCAVVNNSKIRKIEAMSGKTKESGKYVYGDSIFSGLLGGGLRKGNHQFWSGFSILVFSLFVKSCMFLGWATSKHGILKCGIFNVFRSTQNRTFF